MFKKYEWLESLELCYLTRTFDHGRMISMHGKNKLLTGDRQLSHSLAHSQVYYDISKNILTQQPQTRPTCQSISKGIELQLNVMLLRA